MLNREQVLLLISVLHGHIKIKFYPRISSSSVKRIESHYNDGACHDRIPNASLENYSQSFLHTLDLLCDASYVHWYLFSNLLAGTVTLLHKDATKLGDSPFASFLCQS